MFSCPREEKFCGTPAAGTSHIVSFSPGHLGGRFFFVQRRLLRPGAVKRPAPGPQHRSGRGIRMVLDPVNVHFCSSILWLPGDILSSDALSCTLLTMPCHAVLGPRPKPTSSSAEQSTGSGPPRLPTQPICPSSDTTTNLLGILGHLACREMETVSCFKAGVVCLFVCLFSQRQTQQVS